MAMIQSKLTLCSIPTVVMEVRRWTLNIFVWLLLIYSFQFRSAFQPRSAIAAVAQVLFSCYVISKLDLWS